MNENVNKIKDIFQDCNINFFIGSGLSTPFFKMLGDIEILLTALSEENLTKDKAQIIEASLYKKYFEGVIEGNIKVLENDASAQDVLRVYKEFLQTINIILLSRKSTILSKQVNIFTTNIDIFLEKALEEIGLEYNDGFSGRFNPTFRLSDFKKSCFRTSLHYDNTSEIPVFNLVKLHGSLTWSEATKETIHFSSDLSQVKEIKKKMVSNNAVTDVPSGATIATLNSAIGTKSLHASVPVFLEAYKKLLIINPTKDKFKDTLFGQTYYDLLRIYSNQLEKENTVLFVMGFSFADEHIRALTLRAANSNPTLIIYVVARSSASKGRLEQKLNLRDIKNNNIKVISPSTTKDAAGVEKDNYELNFSKMNEAIFKELLRRIQESEKQKIGPTTADRI